MKKTLSILALLSALIHIPAEYTGNHTIIYIFKPLTMLFIIVIAVDTRTLEDFGYYKKNVITGLIFSIFGDIFLMLPQDLFIPGLISFLIAHIFYIRAFLNQDKVKRFTPPQFLLVAYGIAIYLVLSPNLSSLRIPVIAYILIILTMLKTAADQNTTHKSQWSTYALYGAALFVISDTVLALNKFGYPFISARATTLITYFSAQWLIANSIPSKAQNEDQK